MSFFYDRRENDQRTVIRFTKYPFLFISVYGGFAVVLLSRLMHSDAAILLGLPFFAGIFVFSVPYWAVYSEIKKRMRETGGKVYGSKYSFKNPLTFELPKHPKPSGPPPIPVAIGQQLPPSNK